MIDQVEADAYAREAGDPLPKPFVRYQPPRFVSEAEQDAIEERAAAAREEAAHRAERAPVSGVSVACQAGAPGGGGQGARADPSGGARRARSPVPPGTCNCIFL